ncbi:MAG TPA: tyrosine-protein phosphatase, partial [Thermomicrobiaceae bacterium]|nr:tyrosine-protein phosphatase [Thermomicrobiaceae bacterium]
PRNVVAQDYALTERYRGAFIEQWLENGPGDRAAREATYAQQAAREEVLFDVLSHLDEMHGGATRYLLDAGLTVEDIARIQARILTAGED